MLIHYFRIAWRNLRKNKAFSIINIVGLTIGLTCCLLMVLYIRHELSYDNFQRKGDRITRVIMEYSMNGVVKQGNHTSTKVLPAFSRNFPEIETGVRMSGKPRIVKYGGKLFTEKRFLYADSTFFKVFSFPLVTGNPDDILSGPNKVVLTESTARKYFGDENPIGKTIYVGGTADVYTVTGIIKDCPSNSQIKFDFLASFSSLNANQEETYFNANFTTFFLLKDKSSIASLQAKIPGFMKKEMAEKQSGNDYITYNLEPMRRIHLYSPYPGFEPNNSITYIYIIGGVALLILLIACFTYVNLSTARSMERAKEVGIRKVTGAYKKQIFWQFISESFILTLLSLCLSFIVAMSLLPAFNNLADQELTMSSLFSSWVIGFIALTIICISLLAGSYPALILSGFQPIKVLKGSFKNTGSGLWLRKSLIIFQFVISAFLIIATFIIQNQLHYIQNKKLGYERDHVVILPMDQKIMESFEVIRSEFKLVPGVQNISRASQDPSNIYGGYSMRRSDDNEDQYTSVVANQIDQEFVKASGLQIIAGADLSDQDMKDVNYEEKDHDKKVFHFILNESAAAQLRWTPEEAIGKKMFLGDSRPGFVKAVVKDFHFSSLHETIKPLVMFTDNWGNIMIVKLSGANLPGTIASLSSKWKSMIKHRPFEYTFLDENYNKLYSGELRIGKVLNIFAGIAILLACLGLFGLSAYSIQQRTKEIGIRKVLGASASGIAVLLTGQFIRLVGIAFILSAPIAWLAMNKWLQDFAYRINIGWLIFALSAGTLLLIAIITVSIQAIKAAIANPVRSLRTE